jgi:hypothetical protein
LDIYKKIYKMYDLILWNCLKAASVSFIAYFIIFGAFPISGRTVKQQQVVDPKPTVNMLSDSIPLEEECSEQKVADPKPTVSDDNTIRLEEECSDTTASLSDEMAMCYICMDDDKEDMIQLTSCQHSAHVGCIRSQLQAKWTGKRISFGYMTCGECRMPLAHPDLTEDIESHDVLKRQVEMLCYNKCQEDDLLESILEEMKPSSEDANENGGELPLPGEVPDRPDAAVVARCAEILSCFLCSQCDTPFCGGRVDCAEDAALDVSKLMCPSCAFEEPLPMCFTEEEEEAFIIASASSDKTCQCSNSKLNGKCYEHGYKFAIYKCDSCCAVATWDCRTNHYCERCHSQAYDEKNYPCPGKESCPLGIDHPPNTSAVHGNNDDGFVLGCSKCFLGADQLEDSFAMASDDSAVNAVAHWDGRF